MEYKKMKSRINMVSIMLFLYDVIVINLSYITALWLRFDCQYSTIHDYYLSAVYRVMPIYTIAMLLTIAGLRLYQSVWRYASLPELVRVFSASAASLVIQIIATLAAGQRMPISYYFIGWILLFGTLAVSRFSYRMICMIYRGHKKSQRKAKNVMIIGAGEGGKELLDELLRSKHLNVQAKCFIDDDSSKHGKYISDVPVVGGREEIMTAAHHYEVDQIILAIPTLSAKEKRDILTICKETGCELLSVPGIYQLVNGDVSVSTLKKVSVEDLLGRDSIKVNLDEIMGYVKGKVVLVTGGGGSIGSELCRQIAANEPKQLIIFDIYENNAYEIEQELKRKYKDSLNLLTLIGSVRDSKRVNQIFETYKPQIVYHAAAHKHVPLMEHNCCEAVKNNVFGTLNIVSSSERYGVKKFTMISTDKAVNPTNVMGATKRMCEMIVLSRSGSKTNFSATRFGNVLGSNGSVIPLFKRQIAAGGPVTLTDRRIIRYFMTIPEASQLVLESGAMARDGELYVLDMGRPVKILELAESMIRLSGFEPYRDINIVETGLRPGEKLYEELLIKTEELTKTDNRMIFIERDKPLSREEIDSKLEILRKAVESQDDEKVRRAMKRVVDTYHAPEEVNSSAVEADEMQMADRREDCAG